MNLRDQLERLSVLAPQFGLIDADSPAYMVRTHYVEDKQMKRVFPHIVNPRHASGLLELEGALTEFCDARGWITSIAFNAPFPGLNSRCHVTIIGRGFKRVAWGGTRLETLLSAVIAALEGNAAPATAAEWGVASSVTIAPHLDARVARLLRDLEMGFDAMDSSTPARGLRMSEKTVELADAEYTVLEACRRFRLEMKP